MSSMSWLKRQLQRLGLKRHIPDPPEDTVRTLIEVNWLILVCYVEMFAVHSKVL